MTNDLQLTNVVMALQCNRRYHAARAAALSTAAYKTIWPIRRARLRHEAALENTYANDALSLEAEVRLAMREVLLDGTYFNPVGFEDRVKQVFGI